MHIAHSLKIGAVICAISFVPALCNAAVSRNTTDQYYRGTSARKATRLLNRIQYDARQTAHRAEVMENLADHTQFAWQTEGVTLHYVRGDINDMGKRLCRLEAMENTVSPADRASLERVRPVLQEMARNADAAIQYRNAHHNGYWAGPFMQDVKSLHAEANTIVRTLQRG